jgi:hypothetical protein
LVYTHPSSITCRSSRHDDVVCGIEPRLPQHHHCIDNYFIYTRSVHMAYSDLFRSHRVKHKNNWRNNKKVMCLRILQSSKKALKARFKTDVDIELLATPRRWPWQQCCRTRSGTRPQPRSRTPMDDEAERTESGCAGKEHMHRGNEHSVRRIRTSGGKTCTAESSISTTFDEEIT